MLFCLTEPPLALMGWPGGSYKITKSKTKKRPLKGSLKIYEKLQKSIFYLKGGLGSS